MANASIKNINLRPAAPADADAVLGLVPELVAFGPPAWRSVSQMIDTDTLVIGRALQGLTDGAAIFVAEDDNGTLVGFVHVCAEIDYYTRSRCGHIADLVVAPDARGRGVGEALMASAEKWARAEGYSMLTLNVFAENTPARALYDRAGFRAETTRYVKELPSD